MGATSARGDAPPARQRGLVSNRTPPDGACSCNSTLPQTNKQTRCPIAPTPIAPTLTVTLVYRGLDSSTYIH
eukprot:3790005-Prymnesium_polylepis.2